VSTHKNVIEINGKLYDAKSGLLLGGKIIRPKRATSIDGVISPRSQTKPYTAFPVKPLSNPVTTQPITRPAKTRPKPAYIKHRTPQRSQTLMRNAVKKPVNVNKPTIHTKKHSMLQHNRLGRAKSVEKNPFIKKFPDTATHQQIHKRTEVLAVKEAPIAHPHTNHRHGQHPTTIPTTTPPPQTSQSEKLFHEALHKISLDEPKKQKLHKRKAKKIGSRVVRWGGAGLAAIVLAGYIGYMNFTNINMQLASARAGFDAQLPHYLPSGYNIKGPISYQPGKITLNFKSNTDQRNYSITQEVSQWNSAALQEHYLAVNNKKFDTVQDAGRTIYLYENGNATWVNGGVWYVIESDSLSSNQLIKIASSL
jgi:hypothetical protein